MLAVRGTLNPVGEKRMGRWYYWLCFLFLLNAIDAFGFIDRAIYGNWVEKGGDLITATIRLLLILQSLTLFGYSYFKNRNAPKEASAGSNLALLTIGFFFLTALWSMNPEATIRAAVVYLFVLIGVIGIARTLEPDRYMLLLSYACLATAVTSIMLAIFSPGIAFWGPDFMGMFPHKNVLGQNMAVGVLASLHCIRIARRLPIGQVAMLFCFLAMTVEAKSTGALLVALSFLGMSACVSLWQKGGAARSFSMVLAFGLAIIFLLMVVAPDLVLELIGKDPTLTGRTEIWTFVINDIWTKPLLGWGYFGFWHLSNPAAKEICDAIQWVVSQAHNGLLELLLNVGAIGTALVFFLFIRNFAIGLRCLRTPARALAVSAIMCFIGLLIQSVSETVLLAATEPLTPVFFITGLMCERAVWLTKYRESQAQSRQSPPASLRISHSSSGARNLVQPARVR
jgi:exopolysaccharide production protein ExoQ